jgi:cysteinyl-tRNA synthetase
MQLPQLKLYNTLSRKKEAFTPIEPPFVGLYVCGPTVYGHPHLGHARPYITFDVLIRYLNEQGFKVRYVRNITDVGHLQNDADEGEDKIAKQAKLERLEPMEVVQTYTNSFRADMLALNNIPPSIEPVATGHIVEQIALTQQIIDNGYGYESNGSVYFDYAKYAEAGKFGLLSGRVFDDALAGNRDLDGQSEKRNPQDFALWKKALPEHIMRWPSPWGDGFPGWHLECSAMSVKYLGKTFDIHGGGLDLLFPHHECEIAQHEAAEGNMPANTWMHVNMLTMNGQKMGKSLGNAISLKQFFTGEHPLLAEAYTPMTIRYFILQAQYRSTLDFSNEALQAARKGYRRLMNGLRAIQGLSYASESDIAFNQKAEDEVLKLVADSYEALSDDLNTAIVIANLFGMLKKINQYQLKPTETTQLSAETFELLVTHYRKLIIDIMGLLEEDKADTGELISTILEFYKEAKEAKDYAKIDIIRAKLKAQGIAVKDMKTGITWAWEE